MTSGNGRVTTMIGRKMHRIAVKKIILTTARILMPIRPVAICFLVYFHQAIEECEKPENPFQKCRAHDGTHDRNIHDVLNRPWRSVRSRHPRNDLLSSQQLGCQRRISASIAKEKEYETGHIHTAAFIPPAKHERGKFTSKEAKVNNQGNIG